MLFSAFVVFPFILRQSQQIPYEVVPTIEPLHHARDIMIDSQEIGLHAWLFNNVLPDFAHIVIIWHNFSLPDTFVHHDFNLPMY